MKTIAAGLVCVTLALNAGAAFANDVDKAPAAKPLAAVHAVAMSDAALSKVVAGAGAGTITALYTTPSASTPNFGVVNGLYNGLYLHAWANTGGCAGRGNLTAGC